MHASGSLIFLAELFNQAAGYEVLEFFVSAQAKHFFATADGVAQFEICENALEKIVKAEHLFFRKDIAKLIGDMVRKATGESGTFRGNCHNEVTIHPVVTKATQKISKLSQPTKNILQVINLKWRIYFQMGIQDNSGSALENVGARVACLGM